MSSWLLWFGALGAPAAWTVQLLLNYSLEEWFACSPSVTARGEVVGLRVPTAALIASTVLTIVAVVAGLVAFSCYRKVGSGRDEVQSRARWMALAGIMNSVLYLIVILASFGPPLLLDVCEVSP
ncbi:MAG: hypothetical protein KY391_07855 [Actinobacteria bacterium]|nr:hypothetical protein [Actinomycetota bacterium]